MTMTSRKTLVVLAATLASLALARPAAAADTPAPAAAGGKVNLLNVSYDPTRELYVDYNAWFAKRWKAKTGQDLSVQQSHGGSGKQARAVLDGLEADVVTLALAYDVDVLASKGKLLPADWAKRLPDNATPFTSTIVFVVRKGNPKGVKDWADLVKPGVGVIVANPKTSGGARWAYLAAYGQALRAGGDAKAREYITALYKNVPVLDSGARGATTTFAERGVGDVLLAWENEAFLLLSEQGKDKFDVVLPSSSILAEPPVAVVDTYADKHGTRAVAEAYLKSLWDDEAQELAAKRGYRPRSKAVAARYGAKFPKLTLFGIDETFGGWTKAQTTHFEDGGTFDQIYRPGK